MTALILAAVHCAVEVVLIAALAAAALLAIAAAVHPCRKADRALADVRAAQDREVPDQLGEHFATLPPGIDSFDWHAAETDVTR